MALTRITSPAITSVSATTISGTLPAANINDTSISNITALPAGVGGKVLQVVTNTTGTSTYTTSTTTWIQTALFVNITPSSSSNKILIIANGNLDGSPTATLGHVSIFRDSTNLGSTNGMLSSYGQNSRVIAGASPTILDSPNSTATITYRLYIKSTNGTVDWNGQSSLSSITAMEIQA